MYPTATENHVRLIRRVLRKSLDEPRLGIEGDPEPFFYEGQRVLMGPAFSEILSREISRLDALSFDLLRQRLDLAELRLLAAHITEALPQILVMRANERRFMSVVSPQVPRGPFDAVTRDLVAFARSFGMQTPLPVSKRSFFGSRGRAAAEQIAALAVAPPSLHQKETLVESLVRADVDTVRHLITQLSESQCRSIASVVDCQNLLELVVEQRKARRPRPDLNSYSMAGEKYEMVTRAIEVFVRSGGDVHVSDVLFVGERADFYDLRELPGTDLDAPEPDRGWDAVLRSYAADEGCGRRLRQIISLLHAYTRAYMGNADSTGIAPALFAGDVADLVSAITGDAELTREMLLERGVRLPDGAPLLPGNRSSVVPVARYAKPMLIQPYLQDDPIELLHQAVVDEQRREDVGARLATARAESNAAQAEFDAEEEQLHPLDLHEDDWRDAADDWRDHDLGYETWKNRYYYDIEEDVQEFPVIYLREMTLREKSEFLRRLIIDAKWIIVDQGAGASRRLGQEFIRQAGLLQTVVADGRRVLDRGTLRPQHEGRSDAKIFEIVGQRAIDAYWSTEGSTLIERVHAVMDAVRHATGLDVSPVFEHVLALEAFREHQAIAAENAFRGTEQLREVIAWDLMERWSSATALPDGLTYYAAAEIDSSFRGTEVSRLDGIPEEVAVRLSKVSHQQLRDVAARWGSRVMAETLREDVHTGQSPVRRAVEEATRQLDRVLQEGCHTPPDQRLQVELRAGIHAGVLREVGEREAPQDAATPKREQPTDERRPPRPPAVRSKLQLEAEIIATVEVARALGDVLPGRVARMHRGERMAADEADATDVAQVRTREPRPERTVRRAAPVQPRGRDAPDAPVQPRRRDATHRAPVVSNGDDQPIVVRPSGRGGERPRPHRESEERPVRPSRREPREPIGGEGDSDRVVETTRRHTRRDVPRVTDPDGEMVVDQPRRRVLPEESAALSPEETAAFLRDVQREPDRVRPGDPVPEEATDERPPRTIDRSRDDGTESGRDMG